jgi:hypothetical protein
MSLVVADDWETATGLVFPPAGTDLRSLRNRQRHHVSWEDRVPTAIFRGNSTGPGTTADTNQRLKLALMSAEWSTDARYMDGNPVDGVRYLDAGVVQWNMRDRKLQGEPMTHIKPDKLPVQLVERVPMYAQAKYKYQVYVDGHCAAMRYASMMPLGSMILRVKSVTKADHMWYFPLLRPHDLSKGDDVGDADHVEVEADLSDLPQVLTWCKLHDAACKRIVDNATTLYEKLISREGLLDYTVLMLREIALRFTPHTALAAEILGIKTPFLAGGTAEFLEELDASEPEGSTDPVGDGGGPWGARHDDWFGADNCDYVSCRIGPSGIPRPKFAEYFARLEAQRQRATKRAREEEPTSVGGGSTSLTHIAQQRRSNHLKNLKSRLAKLGGGDASAGLRKAIDQTGE